MPGVKPNEPLACVPNIVGAAVLVGEELAVKLVPNIDGAAVLVGAVVPAS
jgi:hypothetical protein